jgi:hypothetical protein
MGSSVWQKNTRFETIRRWAISQFEDYINYRNGGQSYTHKGLQCIVVNKTKKADSEAE